MLVYWSRKRVLLASELCLLILGLVCYPRPLQDVLHSGADDNVATTNITLVQSLQDFKMYIDEVTLNWVLLVLAYVGLTMWIVNVLMFVISIIYCKCYMHIISEKANVLGELHGVSIIKPLMDLDPYLQENLESHFQLKYPKLELLLCVHSEEDPAARVVQQLMIKYPHVDATLIVGGKTGIVNPMVNNMAPAFSKVKYDLIWISTSRIKALPEVLIDMVDKIQPTNVALVHQVPYYMDQLGLAGSIDKVYFGTVMPRNYIPFNVVGLCCMTGMSYLIKKQLLDEVGGLPYYGKYLAEDFFMSKALYDKGYQFRLAAIPAQQNVITKSVFSFKDRMVRWNRLRLNMLTFPSVFLEPFVYCFPLGAFSAWCFHFIFDWNPYMYFTIHVLVWVLSDYTLLKAMQNGSVHLSKCEFLSGWLCTNLLLLWIYLEGLVRPNHIVWGNRTYRVTYGGHTKLVKDRSRMEL